jgi:hypothetical protein
MNDVMNALLFGYDSRVSYLLAAMGLLCRPTGQGASSSEVQYDPAALDDDIDQPICLQ